MLPCKLCACSCCCATSWHRTVKQKTLTVPENGSPVAAARVDLENELAQLRETVSSHQNRVNELIKELEEERSASASATSEAMSMILRLQREKADVLMDARNFKRFAEEQMGHDQEELTLLEEALFRREEVLQGLILEIESYRRRLRSIGVDLDDGAFDRASRKEFDDGLDCEYPSLKCRLAGDKDGIAEDLHFQEEIDEQEKDVVAERHENDTELEAAENFRVIEDGESDGVDDELSYRVYAVVEEQEVPKVFVSEERIGEEEGGGVDVEKLYERLRALEEDREVMRKAIITMGTEKAKLALLKEMAQQIQKEVVTEKEVVKKKSWIEVFFFLALVKWPPSFVLWKKKASLSKYTFGLSNANVGLLLLLDRSSQISNFKCPSKLNW